MQCSAVQCSTVQYNAVQCSGVLTRPSLGLTELTEPTESWDVTAPQHYLTTLLFSVQLTHCMELFTVYSVQCTSTVYSVHCTTTVYNVQCTLYSVQCTVYSVQCTDASVAVWECFVALALLDTWRPLKEATHFCTKPHFYN